MLTPKGTKFKIIVLSVITAITLAIHYGWVFQPIFGHVHWIHTLHGRFCYIPIVIAASWFGLRGGFFAAATISLLVMPLIFGQAHGAVDMVAELVEIVFYFFIAILTGALVDREFFARKKQQDAEYQVERSQKLSLVGQMAAGVAHEIKNPLTSIKGAADIITDESTALDARREFSAILQNEVKRIDSTVTEFLSFARPKPSQLKTVNFSEIIEACLKQIGPQAEQANVKIESNLQSGQIVKGDSEKLQQLILNLVLNAIQASSSNDKIEITLRENNRNQNTQLEIIDNGKGITPEEIDKIFEPFYTTKTTGTGLGLAIVRTIVENHDGTIEIKSKPENRTTVTVDLPQLKGGAVK